MRIAQTPDISGSTIGIWTIVTRVGNARGKSGSSTWLCRCTQCGYEMVIRKDYLNTVNKKICTHSPTNVADSWARSAKGKTYKSWHHMIQRCTNSEHRSYKQYGGRGITVCERWLIFDNFVSDMGERPEGKTIDRKNGELGYYKDNCVWADVLAQGRNIRRNIRLTANGETLICAEWARRLGCCDDVIYRRRRRGWSDEKAVTTPVRRS